jgi:ApaG protein
MTTQITQGIKISVRTAPVNRSEFAMSQNQGGYREQYFFSYHITIENQGSHTVQLLRRHWEIFDSCGIFREVSGEGVVGAKPVLQPGDIYEYESGCGFVSEIGKMKGTYLMERKTDGKLFSVNIPEFEMYVPYKLN